jgi:hypothetical protein
MYPRPNLTDSRSKHSQCDMCSAKIFAVEYVFHSHPRRRGLRPHHGTSRAVANIPCSGRANSLLESCEFPARSRQGIRLMQEHPFRVRRTRSHPRARVRVSFDVTSTFGHNGRMSNARAMSELVTRCRLWGGARRRLVAVYRFIRGLRARRELSAKHSLLPRAHSLLAVGKFPARSTREFASSALFMLDQSATANAADAPIFKNSLLNSLLSGNSHALPRRLRGRTGQALPCSVASARSISSARTVQPSASSPSMRASSGVMAARESSRYRLACWRHALTVVSSMFRPETSGRVTPEIGANWGHLAPRIAALGRANGTGRWDRCFACGSVRGFGEPACPRT